MGQLLALGFFQLGDKQLRKLLCDKYLAKSTVNDNLFWQFPKESQKYHQEILKEILKQP